MKRIAFALFVAAGLAPLSIADVVPPPEMTVAPPMTLNELVFAQYGGGWVDVTTNPDGTGIGASLILKKDFTYENSASGTGPGGAAISAIGQGFWFARLTADGTLVDSGKVWTRGK